MPLHIAIVGGGAAAISFLRQLLRLNISSGLKISVFEKGSRIGAGLPYSQKQDCYILNLPASVMEMTPEKTGDFSTWLSSKYRGGSSFPPRHFFGRYLEEVAANLPKEAEKKGAKLEYHPNTEITNIYPLASGKYMLERASSHNKRVIEAETIDSVVLCTGHPPSDTYLELKGKAGYYHNPWGDASFKQIRPQDAVGVLGTRLTAIDVALRLKHQGHFGPILMASRSGLLPAVLSKEIPPHTLKYVTLQSLFRLTLAGLSPLKLEDVFALVMKEIKEIAKGEFDITKFPITDRDMTPQAWLEDQIAKAEAPKPWQQVLFALYPIMPIIWMMLHQSDKQKFMDQYYGTFLSYLAAFPLENALQIREMISSGQLSVNGGVSAVQVQEGSGYMVHARKEMRVQHVFNATGSGSDLKMLPLFQKMADVITENDLGGLKVDPISLRVYNNRGKLYPWMFALGNPTFGDFLATSDMGQIAYQAEIVAFTIAKAMNKEVSTELNEAMPFWVSKATGNLRNQKESAYSLV